MQHPADEIADQPIRLLLNAQQAAARLNVSTSAVWKLIRTGDLGVVEIGRRTLVPADEVEDYVRRAMTRRGR